MREKYTMHTKQSASSIILVQQNDPALVNEVTPPKVASKALRSNAKECILK
jgi:hypothetical protein